MSNFECEQCGAIISDSPTGYTTGCEHYPLTRCGTCRYWFGKENTGEMGDCMNKKIKKNQPNFFPWSDLKPAGLITSADGGRGCTGWKAKA